MHEGLITPGEPIFGTQEDTPDEDVEIPANSQAMEVPSGFPIELTGGKGPQQIDLTEQDKALMSFRQQHPPRRRCKQA